jgi:AraC-like DNA-binding protein
MQSSHTFTVDSAVFDERNLVSAAGLVPVLELAEQTGLSELIAEHVQLPSTRVRSGAVNPAGKPWSMPDLSRAIGVSARTLQDGFQRYVGVSPTCYLREVRLQRARADLSNPALCTTVSDTA